MEALWSFKLSIFLPFYFARLDTLLCTNFAIYLKHICRQPFQLKIFIHTLLIYCEVCTKFGYPNQVVLCRSGSNLPDDLLQNTNILLRYIYSIGVCGLVVEYTPATRLTLVVFPISVDAISFLIRFYLAASVSGAIGFIIEMSHLM